MCVRQITQLNVLDCIPTKVTVAVTYSSGLGKTHGAYFSGGRVKQRPITSFQVWESLQVTLLPPSMCGGRLFLFCIFGWLETPAFFLSVAGAFPHLPDTRREADRRRRL